MKNVYIYPLTAFRHKLIPNPYLDNFMNALESHFYFVNRKRPATSGIFDVIQYVNQIDYIFLNWVEDIPDKKGGITQMLFFILLIQLLKIRKIKIVWTLHNKMSHYKSNYRLKRFLFRFLFRKSDYIITHAREGILYAKENKLKDIGKMMYFPHPLEKKFLSFSKNPTTDILIWGSIIPYKGIDKFLEYLHEHGLQNKYKIKIIGEIRPPAYQDKILTLCNENIEVVNRYIPEDELKQYIADSGIVLFTYAGDSVLSSGVLMDNLSYGAKLLAPCVGAFKDANVDGLIDTYVSYNDLIPLLDKKSNSNERNNLDILSEFIDKSNWQQFSSKIAEWII
jgi:beta-1,4-mannosyltransferase